ncbi:MAG: glycosyltransferase family 4 protein [Thermoplasmata archaeon]
MRVIQVTLRFDSPGGVETTVRELSRRLRESGEDVKVFASDLVDEPGWVRESEFRPIVDGVPVRRFPAIKRSFLPHYPLPVMAGLVDALSESGADVIHAHSHRYGHVLQAAAVARRRNLPLVVSTHYHPADRREPPVKRAFLRMEDLIFGMTAYRTAAAIVVETEIEARLVGEFAPARRIHIIPPGIDLAEWADAAPDRATVVDLPERYLLFAGRIASNKGLTQLFDAVARIPAAERLPVVLMGHDWGQRGLLEADARRLGIEGSIRWLGHVPDRLTWRAVVRRAAGLVLPSEWEAFGLVLLEAMAAGTPIVATAVGGVPEVLENGRSGRLVPYDRPDALAEALRGILGDPGTTLPLVARASEHVRAFDWSESVRRHRELYRSVAVR